MEYKRMRYLDLNPEEGIEKHEAEQGWHRCPDWDFMLIGPDDPEWESCLCNIKLRPTEPAIQQGDEQE